MEKVEEEGDEPDIMHNNAQWISKFKNFLSSLLGFWGFVVLGFRFKGLFWGFIRILGFRF